MVFTGPGAFERREFDVPALEPDWGLLKVDLVSICGSDIHRYTGHSPSPTPMILGHEVMGTVVDLGPQAKEFYQVEVGDRVTVEPYLLCGRCHYCLHGNYAVCVERRCYGVTLTCDRPPHLLGAYSQYMVLLPYSKLLRYGPEVEPREGCLSSVLGNGVRWVRTKGECGLGDRVVILGPGPQGLMSVVAAGECGAGEIIVVGLARDRQRLELAERFGAHRTVVLESGEDTETSAAKIVGDNPVDLVVEASGSAAAYALAPHLLRSGGRLSCAGVPGGDGMAELPMRLVVRKELTLRGGLGQSWDVEAAVDIINAKKYPMGDIITHVFPLDQAGEAMRLLTEHPDQCVRAALDPWA